MPIVVGYKFVYTNKVIIRVRGVNLYDLIMAFAFVTAKYGHSCMSTTLQHKLDDILFCVTCKTLIDPCALVCLYPYVMNTRLYLMS